MIKTKKWKRSSSMQAATSFFGTNQITSVNEIAWKKCNNKTLPKSPQTYNVPCITLSKKYVYFHVSVSRISLAS